LIKILLLNAPKFHFAYRSQDIGFLLREFWGWGSVGDFNFSRLRAYVVSGTFFFIKI